MCELFAMSARHPATVRMSLEEFARHGGGSGPHKDGWGIAWDDDGDLRVVKETHPAAASPCVRFIQSNPFATTLALSHIRRATQGAVATRNCQPFVRELGGRWHAFAHNGDLRGSAGELRTRARRFAPVGETDSERAFCALLNRLAPLWGGGQIPPLAVRWRVISRFAARLRALGPANFLYVDGDALFAHADRRTQSDGSVRPPGLWVLSRRCAPEARLATAGLRIDGGAREQRVTLFASVALTAEAWRPLAPGALVAARRGALYRACSSSSA